jgi:hypothetical protein
MKCNKTQSIWCINKHVASKIIDTFETYQTLLAPTPSYPFRSAATTAKHGLGLVSMFGLAPPHSNAAAGAPNPLLPLWPRVGSKAKFAPDFTLNRHWRKEIGSALEIGSGERGI